MAQQSATYRSHKKCSHAATFAGRQVCRMQDEQYAKAKREAHAARAREWRKAHPNYMREYNQSPAGKAARQRYSEKKRRLLTTTTAA